MTWLALFVVKWLQFVNLKLIFNYVGSIILKFPESQASFAMIVQNFSLAYCCYWMRDSTVPCHCCNGLLFWNPNSLKIVPLERKSICPTACYPENKCPLHWRPITLKIHILPTLFFSPVLCKDLPLLCCRSALTLTLFSYSIIEPGDKHRQHIPSEHLDKCEFNTTLHNCSHLYFVQLGAPRCFFFMCHAVVVSTNPRCLRQFVRYNVMMAVNYKTNKIQHNNVTSCTSVANKLEQ